MGFQITYTYGDFEMSHSSSDDTKTSMENGVYATAHRWLMSQAVAIIDSKVLTCEEEDEEAAVAELNKNDMPAEVASPEETEEDNEEPDG